jgi:alginate O-acetyltransferase complex protein AlgI
MDAWYGLVAYTFQIYFDFSGYSGYVGLGLMLDSFAKNFDSPYGGARPSLSSRRWHPLSTWLRDYLYATRGNRRGTVRTYRNLMLTMLLGSLARRPWNFVIRKARRLPAAERGAARAGRPIAIPRFVRVLATFLIVMLAWVFFRAPSLARAIDYMSDLAGLGQPGLRDEMATCLIYQRYYVLSLIVCALIVWKGRQAWDITRQVSWPRAVACVGVFCLAIVALFTQSFNPFIYYIF